MEGLLTEVEVLRYLGERFGMHCGGVEYALDIGTASSAHPKLVHDVHLLVDQEDDIWEHTDLNSYQEVIPEDVGPLLEDFHRVVDEAFDEFSASTALRKHAFVELKVWKENLATKET